MDELLKFITIRKFMQNDIENKIRWINNSENNKFLHYDLPLEYNKTLMWFEKNKDNINRYDGIIEYCKTPVGLIGLLNIDYKNKKAEYYITIGESKLQRKRNSVYCSGARKAYAKFAFEDISSAKIKYIYIQKLKI